MRHETCVICESPHLRALRGYERAHLVRCRSCGMTFAGQIPTDEELSRQYADYGHEWIDSQLTRLRYRALLDSFERYRVTGRLLDIGCGAGYFLEEASAAGWEIHGTEYGDRAVAICREKGLAVEQAPILPETFEQASFDVITAFEVFEHVRDPRREAAMVAQWLRPGGLLYCTTPNFNAASRKVLRSSWNVIEYPEHLCYFTPRTLRSWLRRSGFRAVAVQSSGVSIGRLRAGLSAASAASGAPVAADERMRTSIERSRGLRAAKAVVNAGLSATGSGDTLKGRFEAAGG